MNSFKNEFEECETEVKSKRKKTNDMESPNVIKKQIENEIYKYIIKIMTKCHE